MKSESTSSPDQLPSPESPDDYNALGEVARQLGKQTQYTSHYLTGIGGFPNLGEGLDFVEGNAGNYHSTLIRRADADELIRRILKHNQSES